MVEEGAPPLLRGAADSSWLLVGYCAPFFLDPYHLIVEMGVG